MSTVRNEEFHSIRIMKNQWQNEKNNSEKTNSFKLRHKYHKLLCSNLMVFIFVKLTNPQIIFYYCRTLFSFNLYLIFIVVKKSCSGYVVCQDVHVIGSIRSRVWQTCDSTWQTFPTNLSSSVYLIRIPTKIRFTGFGSHTFGQKT